jgi:hypothetical protein
MNYYEALGFEDPRWLRKSGSLDAMQYLARSVIEYERRLHTVEKYLEEGAPQGKSFVRREERPAVGGVEVREIEKDLAAINERLSAIEKSLSTESEG